MDDRGNLLSRLRFSGIVRIWDVVKRKRVVEGEPDTPYWVVKDEFGATFLCWEEGLKDKCIIGEKFEITGEIKIGKGGIYLIIKSVNCLNTTISK